MDPHARLLQLVDTPWSLNAHHYGMPYIWIISINIGIFLVHYKYRPIWMFAHVLIGFGVAFITLLFAIPIIQRFSIPA